MGIHIVKHNHEYNCEYSKMTQDTVSVHFYARTLSDK